ncbi:hypothetical protein [Maritalea mobilis]|nr:hypothetical protein [Maritalea mobilis]
MGDKHATILRMVTAYYVLQQAETNEVYSVDDRFKRSFSFSHLYTGISYSEVTDFLEMRRPSRDRDPEREPVHKNNFEKLRKLLVWLYGSKSEDVSPVVKSQNPDLGKLKEVLSDKQATKQLEASGDLNAATITATPIDVRFSRHLFVATEELQKALQSLDGFDPETQSELQSVAESAVKRANLILNTINSVIDSLEKSSTEK